MVFDWNILWQAFLLPAMYALQGWYKNAVDGSSDLGQVISKSEWQIFVVTLGKLFIPALILGFGLQQADVPNLEFIGICVGLFFGWLWDGIAKKRAKVALTSSKKK